MPTLISKEAVERRKFWVERISQLSGNFIEDTKKLEQELENEINITNYLNLIDHLRLCGNIPECYKNSSSEEKLYSKYTDCLLSISYNMLGLKSFVLQERSDSADVEVFANKYNFVADAKSFRLGRTAKNQKDFKIQAMDVWKRGKPYAMVVCPIHQLPNTSSQIYQQATARNVCIFTYSHLSLLLNFSNICGKDKAQELLEIIFKVIPALNPSKDANNYWLAINKTILSFSKEIDPLWKIEKEASIASILIIFYPSNFSNGNTSMAFQFRKVHH